MSKLALAIAQKGRWDADQLVLDLMAAGIPESVEVHVSCDVEHGRSHSRLLVHPLAEASLFDLWSLAIKRNRAPWIAVLHGDGLPGDGWFNAIIRKIECDQWPDGYWGPVEPRARSNAKIMLGYLNEYCQFHRPIEARMHEIPGSNLVLPRARLGSSQGFSKTRLVEEGLAPKFVADAVVYYGRSNDLRSYCSRRFHHGRAYAAERTPRLSFLKAIPLTAALPIVRTGRVVRHAWRHRSLRFPVARLFLRLLLAESCWSAGELIGYLTRRPGDATALD